MHVIQLAFASLFVLASGPTLVGANVYEVLEGPKHTVGEGGIARAPVTSTRPRVRFLQEPILPNVENAYLGIDEVASAGPAEVLHEDPVVADNVDVAVADNVDVAVVVDVAVEPRSDREEVSPSIGVDINIMVSGASNSDPTGVQSSELTVPKSRKLLTTCTGGSDVFAATDGGLNGVLYQAVRNYQASCVGGTCVETSDSANKYGFPMNCWKVGAIFNFDRLFRKMYDFNQDISSWDTSQVLRMYNAFSYNRKFNQDLSSWDTSKVTNMQSMFHNAEIFNQDVSSWNMEQVGNMNRMFYNTYAFNQELCLWGQQTFKVSKSQYINREGMFAGSACPDTDSPSSKEGPWCSTTSQANCAIPSTVSPSESPSTKPSTSPSVLPSTSPSESPSTKPSTSPSESPSAKPSTSPSAPPSTSPSESPSTKPSTSPSESPSAKPSTSPSESPSTLDSTDVWRILFTGLDANFTAISDTELLLKYDIGKNPTSNGSAAGRYKTKLYEKDCSTEVSTSGAGPLLFNLTDNGRIIKSPANNTFDEIKLLYNVNKTAIASSSVWNSTAKEIEVCQVIQLIEDSAMLGKMVIVEAKRVVSIEFDLDVNISLGVGMGEGTVDLASGYTSVDDYVTAYKCNENFDQDDTPLVPNEMLSVCIESNSTDVEIKEIETMTLTQVGASNLPIIVNSTISSPQITGNTVVSSIKQVVFTRVPINLFTFANDQSIDVEGKVVMQLDGSSARRLQANSGTGGTEAAAFAVRVTLQPKAALVDGVELHSSASIASRAFISLGVTLALTAW